MNNNEVRLMGGRLFLFRSGGARILGLFAFLVVLGFSFQGTRSVWGADEGRYIGNAIQMMDAGNYLVPAYSPDRVNFSKPPMTYWAIAAAMKAFGRTTWAVRMPYALAFALTALLVYGMGLRLVPERPWLPCVVYATSVLPFIAANIVSTDVLLACFETLAMFGFVAMYWHPERSSRWRYLLLMWLGFGLAFLTKGPPGLIPLLGVVPFVIRREGWSGLARVFHPLGLLVFAVVGLTWYVVVVVRYPWVLHYFIHYEVYDRIFTPVQNRHPQWYGWIVVYLPVLLVGALPWWPLLKWKWAPGAGWRDLGQSWKKADTRMFLLLWILVPLAVFCLAKSRLPLYILPLFVPISLLLAMSLKGRVQLRSARQWFALGSWVLILLAIKGGMSIFAHSHRDDRLRTQMFSRQAAGVDYGAVAFIENTAGHESIEEHTPWGMRFYNDKPIYGVAWKKPAARQRVCTLLGRHRSVIFAVDQGLHRQDIDARLHACHATVSIRSLGTFQHWTLELVRREG